MVNRFVLFSVSCVFVVFWGLPAFAGEAADLTFIRKVNPITMPRAQENCPF